MRVFVVMYNNGEGDRLERIFDSREAAEAYIEKQDYNWLYDYYSYDVNSLVNVNNLDNRNMQKAINIAIRYHFANSAGFESQIYNRLLEFDKSVNIDNIEFADINPSITVWSTFVRFYYPDLMTSIDLLIDDIVAEFSGD